jgi:hypothetical protein
VAALSRGLLVLFRGVHAPLLYLRWDPTSELGTIEINRNDGAAYDHHVGRRDGGQKIWADRRSDELARQIGQHDRRMRELERLAGLREVGEQGGSADEPKSA